MRIQFLYFADFTLEASTAADKVAALSDVETGRCEALTHCWFHPVRCPMVERKAQDSWFC